MTAWFPYDVRLRQEMHDHGMLLTAICARRRRRTRSRLVHAGYTCSGGRSQAFQVVRFLAWRNQMYAGRSTFVVVQAISRDLVQLIGQPSRRRQEVEVLEVAEEAGWDKLCKVYHGEPQISSDIQRIHMDLGNKLSFRVSCVCQRMSMALDRQATAERSNTAWKRPSIDHRYSRVHGRLGHAMRQSRRYHSLLVHVNSVWHLEDHIKVADLEGLVLQEYAQH